MPTHKTPKAILVFIVIAQFACTSLWFAGNAVVGDIIRQFHLQSNALGHLVSAVQLGFITGTLLFAILSISDQFSPSKVFFCCALAGAASNLLMFAADGMTMIILSRFATGFFLAGIYPVGMKIASDHHKEGLGKALGYLVGALVLGTAFPHFINGMASSAVSWKSVILGTSVLAAIGGCVIVLFVPDGPNRVPGQKVQLTGFLKVFTSQKFRSATFGYFGHMWELYAFWAFLPVILTSYLKQNNLSGVMNVSLVSFSVIVAGAFSCVIGGYLSKYVGSAKVAFVALAISGTCCFLSPFIFGSGPTLFFIILFIWGMAVTADSPQFSTLVAQSAPPESKGTALTISTSIGFLITVISIELLNVLRSTIDPSKLYLVLGIGPLLGLTAMNKIIKDHSSI